MQTSLSLGYCGWLLALGLAFGVAGCPKHEPDKSGGSSPAAESKARGAKPPATRDEEPNDDDDEDEKDEKPGKGGF